MSTGGAVMSDEDKPKKPHNVINAQFGKRTPVDLTDCQQKLSDGCRALDDGDYRSAARLLERSFDYAGKLGASEYQVLSLLALGDALQMDGYLDRAQERLHQAAKIAQESGGHKSILYAYAVGALGTVYLQQRNLREARNLLEISVDVLKKNRRHAGQDFLHSFLDLLNCYLVCGDWFAMDKLAKYAYELSRSVLGDSDTSTVMCQIFCALAARELGRLRRYEILLSGLSQAIRPARGKISDRLGLYEGMIALAQLIGMGRLSGKEFQFSNNPVVKPSAKKSAKPSLKSREKTGPSQDSKQVARSSSSSKEEKDKAKKQSKGKPPNLTLVP